MAVAEVLDVDGDGRKDIYVGTGFGPRLLYQERPLWFVDQTSERLRGVRGGHQPGCRDVDRDGDIDLLIPGLTPGFELLINDGSGHFFDEAAQRFPVVPYYTSWAEFIDVNGDDAADIISLVQFERNGRWRIALYMNRGNGTFVEVFDRLPPVSQDRAITRMMAADWDRDGDQDLLASPYLWRNDAGRFVELPGALWSDGVLGDVDGDGDLDFVGNVGENGIWVAANLQTQVACPLLAHAGRRYELGLSSRPGANPGEIAVPMFAARLGSPIDFGMVGKLRLDLGSLWVGPRVTMPRMGSEVVHMILPNDPQLVGSQFAFQTLFVDPTNLHASRLSNALVDRVVQ